MNLPESGPALEKERLKAQLIIETMGALGYAAMAVGERDVALGLEELKTRAAAARLPLLAANLVDAKGNKPFAGRRVVEVGGIKVGLFAVSTGEGFARAGLTVQPAAKEAQVQADALRKEGAAFVVALLHQEYGEAMQLTSGLKNVDFVIQAHDGRTSGMQLVGETLLVGGGERGRHLGRAKFTLDGKGPYFDLSEAGNAREQLGFLETNIVELQKRMKEDPSRKAQHELVLANFNKRKAELTARINAQAPKGQRSVGIDMVALDAKVADDPALKKKVEAFVKKHGATNAH